MSFDPEFDKFRAQQKMIQSKDKLFSEVTAEWVAASVKTNYSYGFDWLGVPIIQFPTDLIAFQEIVFSTRPSLIIECGVARGGSAIFWASMQQICGITPNVIGVDIDIRPHAISAINHSSFSDCIKLVVGSSIDSDTFAKVKSSFNPDERVMVVLDSNHTHEHVFEELKLYAELVSVGSYLLVLDTVIANIPKDVSRPWGPDANPQSAVLEFMSNRTDFVNDKEIEDRIGITVAPKGYWKRLR